MEGWFVMRREIGRRRLGRGTLALKTPSRDAFTGFADHYEAVVAPYLTAHERRRRSALLTAGAASLAAVAVAAAVAWKGPFWPNNAQVAALIGGAGLLVARGVLGRARELITHGLLARVAEGLDLEYRRRPGAPQTFGAFRRTRLLPGSDFQSFEDEVAGEHSGARFRLLEAHLERETRDNKGRKRRRTVFHGQLAVIAYPKPFLGVTIVGRDRGLFNRFAKPGAGFSNVGLVSSEFERAFEAWSTDQVEARELLDPVVLERFQALETLFRGKNLRAAFVDGALLIALETGDSLSMGTMFRKLNDPRRVERILEEFDVIFDLVDLLVKRVDRPLDEAIGVRHVR